jgi:hypothetical protein
MTGKLDFTRSLRGAAWALTRVSCVGLLFLGTTHCLPAPAADDGGSAGSNGGSVSPQGGTTHAATGGSTYVPPQGGSTYVQPSGGSTYVQPSGGSTYVQPSGGSTYVQPSGGSTYVQPSGGTPEGGSTYVQPSGGSTYVTPTGGTTTTPPAGGSTAVTTCTPAPKSTGGLSCPGGKCTVGTYSGYDFGFSDGLGSTYCVDANSLCAAGTTAAQNPPAYTIWGAGFGFSLSPLTTLTTSVPVQLTGSGVSVTLSSLPTGGATARVQVTVDGTQYCAVMTAASQTIPWASFNTKCWAATTGTALTGAPNTTNVQIEASAGATAGAYDFCVTALSFQ